ncbi:g2-specific protein kinase nima [Acrodontium crateriforme]|uniref:non-specific serine/threonine protein kinase n=1 Tax=Acrodontium crateriforme TaxID=150365 RepID=A0AAQ3LXR6_9PEZI|nr:g2-specific protein kinase nima [Acrodontium crateriforme]
MAEKDGEKYDVLEKIGQGSFGIIRKVRRKNDGQILCRKEISYTRMSDKEKNQLYAELKILESLRHPNIVQYCHREHLKSCNDLHLYMEYCGNGDLGDYIKKLKANNQYADEEFVWTIFAQLVSALYRCHYGEDPPAPGSEGAVKKGKTFQTKEGYRVILHRDLKPENVFLGQNNAVKLGDFGLSKIIAAHDFASTYVGTPFYMSPEICAAERYSHHSDVWSLGCIIYELASRCVPFDARTHVELIMKIKAGRIKTLPPQFSPELMEVIQWCLKVDPRNRPDTAQLLNIPQIKLARSRLEQIAVVETAQKERDSAIVKLQAVQKQVQELQAEVTRLRESSKKVEMEWHTRATLAIDQRVSEEIERQKSDFEQQLAALRLEDEKRIEQRVAEELRLHYGSLPASHGASQASDAAVHVRSSTPPPGKAASFATATTATTHHGSDRSSVAGDAPLESDMSSLSMMEAELRDDVSPLAERTKPLKKASRKPFGRAQTLANYSFGSNESPMDVHMADPSPMPNHVAPMSIKGLSLSPRKNGGAADRMTGLRKNIFSMAQEQRLRPAVGGENRSFSDDFDNSDEDEALDLADSPSRPSSGLSAHSNVSGGDPFKGLGNGQLPVKRTLNGRRPSLTRQQTMPMNFQSVVPRYQRQTSNSFNKYRTKSPEKENRPPSASGRPNAAVPVINAASPKRPTSKDTGRALTPNRKAPPPPAGSNIGGLLRQAQANTGQTSPVRAVKGRTLAELAQGRITPTAGFEFDVPEVPKWLASPAKWDPVECGEEMPSPFLAKKGRAQR